jgi:transposase-like protein
MTNVQEIPKRKRRSGQEVRRLVVEFEGSGLRMAEFCRIHGVAQSTLGRQLKRRRLEDGQARAWGEQCRGDANRLVAVELTSRDQDDNAQRAFALRVVLSNGRRIEVGPHFDADSFEQLIKILERL